MTATRTSFTRHTSAAAIAVLVVTSVLAICCVTSMAPLTGGFVADAAACAIGAHGTGGLVGTSAQTPATAALVIGALAAMLVLGGQRERIHGMPVVLQVLPPPADPRHGRIRV